MDTVLRGFIQYGYSTERVHTVCLSLSLLSPSSLSPSSLPPLSLLSLSSLPPLSLLSPQDGALLSGEEASWRVLEEAIPRLEALQAGSRILPPQVTHRPLQAVEDRPPAVSHGFSWSNPRCGLDQENPQRGFSEITHSFTTPY